MTRRALLVTLAIFLVAMVASPAVADDRDVYTFEGRGWGHSVGLSQYGARGMAMEGYGYQEIVTHYYKGTSVGTIADTVASDSFLRTNNRPVWVGLLQSLKSTTFSPYVVEDGHTVQVCQNKLSTGRRCANAKAGQEWKVRVADKGGCRVLRNDNRVWETRGKCRVDVTWDEAPTRILLSGTGYTYARGVLHVRPVPGKKAVPRIDPAFDGRVHQGHRRGSHRLADGDAQGAGGGGAQLRGLQGVGIRPDLEP